MNLAFGATILWLPLTFAAIGRAAFVKYKFTDKRISVATTAPWKGASSGLMPSGGLSAFIFPIAPTSGTVA